MFLINRVKVTLVTIIITSIINHHLIVSSKFMLHDSLHFRVDEVYVALCVLLCFSIIVWGVLYCTSVINMFSYEVLD